MLSEKKSSQNLLNVSLREWKYDVIAIHDNKSDMFVWFRILIRAARY